jgi:hypothetical protein
MQADSNGSLTLARCADLNALLPTGGDGGSKGHLAGSWARHWPVHYPGSPRDYRLSWAGLIRIDGTTYEFLGACGAFLGVAVYSAVS